MKNLTQLIQEKKEEWTKEFEDQYGLEDPCHTFHDHDDFLIIKENFMNWHTSSLTAIISSEIERKKGMVKDTVTGREDGFCRCGVSYYECDCVGYNIAIAEDLSYLENILQELENK